MRRISSKATFAYKIGVPVLYLIVVLVVGLMSPIGDAIKSDEIPAFVYIAACLPLLAVAYWVFFPLKNISIADEGLVVTGIKKKIVVRFVDIERVSRSVLQNPETIFLHLKSDSDFGRRISFMPEVRFWRFSEHPTYVELQRIVGDACRPG